MKTALSIIHRIGEQKLMDTSRGFVQAVVGVSEGRRTHYSKPDTLSETLEPRSLQAKGSAGADFYECYLAHLVTEARLRASILWLVGLAWRSAQDVPRTSKPL